MALNLVSIPVTLTSVNGADVNGEWIHIGSMALDVQFHTGVGNFNRLEISADKQDNDVATDIAGVAITALGAVYRVVRDRPKWVRVVLLDDSTGGVVYTTTLMVRKEDG